MDQYIGQLVHKRSWKPFKSGRIINTVAGITTNPHTGAVAFTFREDDSIVDCATCMDHSGVRIRPPQEGI